MFADMIPDDLIMHGFVHEQGIIETAVVRAISFEKLDDKGKHNQRHIHTANCGPDTGNVD